MSVALATAFYTQATASQGAGTFYAAVTGRVYFSEAPENGLLPLCVFRIVESTVSPAFDGKSICTARIVADSYVDKATGPEAATGIDDKLFAAVHLAIVSGVTGFDRATIRCESRGVTEALPDEDAIVASSTYTVTGATTS